MVVASLLLLSCSIIDDYFGNPSDKGGEYAPVTEKSDDYEITYQFKDNVIVLDDQNIQHLVKVMDDDILYFDSSTPSNIKPKVGSIISSRITEKTPYGLGNKVIEVTNEDGMTKCITEVATLDEIFEELELQSTTSLQNLVGSSIIDEDGNTHDVTIENYEEESDENDSENAREMTRATIGSPEVLSITVPYKSSNGLFAQLKLSIGTQLTFNVSLANHTFELSREDFIGFGGTVGLEKSGSKDVFTLLRCRLLNGVLALGPVVLRPYIDLDSYVGVNASGVFETGFQKSVSMKYGFTEKGWFFNNNTNNGDKFFNKLSLNGRLGIGPTIQLDMGAGLYTKNVAVELRPKVNVEIAGELDLSNNNLFKLNPTMNFDATIGVEGGFVARFFKWEMASFDVDLVKYNLLNLSWPLLPRYVENTLNVTKRSSSPLIFDGKYDVIGSALGKLLGIQPILKVYQDKSLIYDVYNVMGANNLKIFTPYTMTYELSNLKKNVAYTAKPAFEIAGLQFEGDESVIFQYNEFPVEITDFKQTGSEYKKDGFSHNGKTYSYQFDCTVTVTLKNSDNVEDWGWVYCDPDGQEAFISLKSFSSPYPDSRYVYLRNEAKSTATVYPYVKLRGEERQTGEPHDYPLEHKGETTCPDGNHPHMIDLGLPSGTKWACCNVGASAPEEYGNYYAWGEIQPKNVYNRDTYQYYQNGNYVNIGSDIAGTQYDAATANWGAPWRMPSLTQINELLNNCTSTWTTQNGVNGRKFTGPNGGTIFLPAAGSRWFSDLSSAGSYGYYWSSALYESNPYCAYLLVFYSDNAHWNYKYDRFNGHSVRPVR